MFGGRKCVERAWRRRKRAWKRRRDYRGIRFSVALRRAQCAGCRIDSTILIHNSAWLLSGLAVWPIKRLLRRARPTPMASPLSVVGNDRQPTTCPAGLRLGDRARSVCGTSRTDANAGGAVSS